MPGPPCPPRTGRGQRRKRCWRRERPGRRHRVRPPRPPTWCSRSSDIPTMSVRCISAPTASSRVSGAAAGARTGTLPLRAGGDASALERVRPLLAALGRTIVHEGGPGTGQHTKMCNQIVIAGTMIGVCESLLYRFRAGLDLETMLQSIRGGAAGCWALDNLAPRVLKKDFAPGFLVDHFIKDMGIALDEAARMPLALPGLARVRHLSVATAAQGHGRYGTHALFLGLDAISRARDPNA